MVFSSTRGGTGRALPNMCLVPGGSMEHSLLRCPGWKQKEKMWRKLQFPQKWQFSAFQDVQIGGHGRGDGGKGDQDGVIL